MCVRMTGNEINYHLIAVFIVLHLPEEAPQPPHLLVAPVSPTGAAILPQSRVLQTQAMPAVSRSELNQNC